MHLRDLYFLIVLVFSFIQLSGQSFTNYTVADGLADNVVNCVTVDSDNNIWFGTNSGISKFDGISEWTTYSTADSTGLVDDLITAIHVQDNGQFWVGTDFGVSWWDGSKFTTFTIDEGIGNNRIQDISEDGQGNIILGHKSGIAIGGPTGWWTDNAVFPFGGVTSISVIENDLYALGLGLSGVGIYEVGSDLTIYDESDGLLSNNVRAVFYDQVTEAIWTASAMGVDHLIDDVNDILQLETYPSVFELPPPHEVNLLTDIKIDSKGIVWGGVHIDYLVNVGGITYFDGNVWTSLDVDDGLVGPVVAQLAIDADDCVWVATSTGVSKYCKEGSAVNEIVNKSRIQVLPNPFRDNLTVQISGDFESNQQVNIYNLLGERVYSFVRTKGTYEETISLSHLDRGVYFIGIANQVVKVVKE